MGAGTVVVVSDEGLGGVAAFGPSIREAGLAGGLILGRAGQPPLGQWESLYDWIEIIDDPYRPEALVDIVRRRVRQDGLAALFSCYDGLVLPAALAARSLGIPHPAIAGLRRSRNKVETRRALEDAGLQGPRYATVGSERDCRLLGDRLAFPAIIKPINGMASHLVRRVESSDELVEQLRYLRERIVGSYRGNYLHAPGSGLDPTRVFLVEEFLRGKEYSADLIVRDGELFPVALFEKFIVEPRRFLECGFSTPPLAGSPAVDRAIWNYLRASIKALAIDNAAVHAEVIITKSGPALVEANTGRAGGQILVMAMRERFGIDMIAEILALQRGAPRPPRQRALVSGRLSSLTVFPRCSGVLASVSGIEDVAELEGVRRVVAWCRPGDYLDMDDKEFFAVNLLVEGLSEPALRQLYENACRLIQFEFASTSRIESAAHDDSPSSAIRKVSATPPGRRPAIERQAAR